VQAAVTAHGAALEPVSIKTAPEPVRLRINGWVEEQTARRIRDLVPAGGVDDQTRLVLANAVYFLGDWQDPFDSKRTQPHRFRLSRTKSKDVPFMLFGDVMHFRSAERDGLKALELPYEGGALSMLFLLPDKVDGEAAVEAALTPDRLDAIVNSLSASKKTVVALPKFEINPLQSFALGGILKEMGMPQAFDREKADFTGIADPPDPRDRFFLGNIFHKAFLKVDEKGTEAGVATAAAVLAGAALKPPKPLVFLADHPFLFFLRHNASGLVLFMGRVSDPSLN
jgi:serpin B